MSQLLQVKKPLEYGEEEKNAACLSHISTAFSNAAGFGESSAESYLVSLT